ncbi:hypothetical protein [Frigoribacterium sp. VKM Ac-2530]|uniref:hypothetical protein n=1 Tax=Frigoribacterium sp. VKM Ac-2530 TaxID=2783822 RepID=UPI00188A1538|nr:hypothetical protein [Frigoribacterium sp. VKM Ac-2530]MBF4578919.1 hypothetical protein [Frigoribacterium sp. VKM Ac-2530]
MPRRQLLRTTVRAATRFSFLVAALYVFGLASTWLVAHPLIVIALVGTALLFAVLYVVGVVSDYLADATKPRVTASTLPEQEGTP